MKQIKHKCAYLSFIYYGFSCTCSSSFANFTVTHYYY